MKRTLTILFFCLTLAVSALAQTAPKEADKKPAEALPTIDQILAKAIEATGGKAAIEKHNSRVMKGTLEIPAMGMTGTTETYAKAPNKFANIATISGFGSFSQGYDGKIAWSNDPVQGLRELSGAELALARREAEFYSDLKFKEMYPKAVVKGKEKVGSGEAYVVEATPAEGGPEKLYFDVQTGLLVRRDFTLDSAQGQIPTETYLEDYRVVDGVKIPHTIRQSNPAVQFTIKVTEVKHNVPVDDAKFNKPSGQ
jgi:hypothetical protein